MTGQGKCICPLEKCYPKREQRERAWLERDRSQEEVFFCCLFFKEIISHLCPDENHPMVMENLIVQGTERNCGRMSWNRCEQVRGVGSRQKRGVGLAEERHVEVLP